MTLYAQTKTIDTMLGLMYPTWEFSPKYPFEGRFLQSELKKDGRTFWRDYGCRPTSGVRRYYGNPDIIEIRDNAPNLLEMIHESVDVRIEPHLYVLTGDPAPKNDAFGFALAHQELNTIYIDGLWRFVMKEKEVDPLMVRNFALKVQEKVKMRYFVFDQWSYPILIEEIRRKGVLVHNHIVRKVDHDRVKERFYYKSLVVCNYPFVKTELESLDKVSETKVDHPKGGSKDVADALANAVWTLENKVAKEVHPFNIIMTY